MKAITLGSTGITVPQNAFGALPVQRVDKETAVQILRRAYEGGMRYIDTARAYSDSEEKIGLAFGPQWNAPADGTGDVDAAAAPIKGAPVGRAFRESIFIATKTMAHTPEQFWAQLHQSLELLQTDYIDVYQFHCVDQCYAPGDGTGMYECMLEAKEQGLIRHIGTTAHKLQVAFDCVESGLYETMQFPFSYLSSEKEIALVNRCKEKNMGYIAMKGLAGGLINRSDAAMAFMLQFDNVLPIWGVQRMSELEEWLSFMDQPPSMTEEIASFIEKEKEELSGEFCRGCGYCEPCPAGIMIHQCARMSLMLRRAPSAAWLSEPMQAEMKKIEGCINCRQCTRKCPYGLSTPELLQKNYEDYKKILAGEITV